MNQSYQLKLDRKKIFRKDYETFPLYRHQNRFCIRLAPTLAYQHHLVKPNRNEIVMLERYHFYKSKIKIRSKIKSSLAEISDPSAIQNFQIL